MSEIPVDGTNIDNGGQADKHVQELKTQCKVHARGWYGLWYCTWFVVTAKDEFFLFRIRKFI